MLQSRKSQGSSITIIVAAVIGLIIIVVVIAMLTGKLGAFGKGVEETGNIAKKCTEQGGAVTTLTVTVTGCGTGKTEIQASDTLIQTNKICCK